MRDILYHGQEMLIMENLHNVLVCLRYGDRSQILWIDGVCISQANMVERSQQVLLMKEVYENAETVLCWIGEEKDNTGDAFRIIESLAAVCNTVVEEYGGGIENCQGTVIIDKTIVGGLKDTGWPAVRDVFTRSYFGRIWVVQEILLVTKAAIICGSFQCTLRDFIYPVHMVEIVDSIENLWRTQPAPTGEYFRQFTTQWARPRNIDQLKSIKANSRSLSFCLERMLNHDVTNPWDRVYGILGMIRPQLDYGQNNPLKPDYTKTIQAFY
jgi:hypothetical protein